jgi:hypothetical protein
MDKLTNATVDLFIILTVSISDVHYPTVIFTLIDSLIHKSIHLFIHLFIDSYIR